MNNANFEYKGKDASFITLLGDRNLKFNGQLIATNDVKFKYSKSQNWLMGIFKAKGGSSLFVGLHKCGITKGFFKSNDNTPSVYEAEIQYSKYTPGIENDIWKRHQISST
jgi:hypothetical protein